MQCRKKKIQTFFNDKIMWQHVNNNVATCQQTMIKNFQKKDVLTKQLNITKM